MKGGTNSSSVSKPSVIYNSNGVIIIRYGRLVNVSVSNFTGTGLTTIPNVPRAMAYQASALLGNSSNMAGAMWVYDTVISINRKVDGDFLYGGMNYLTVEGGGTKSPLARIREKIKGVLTREGKHQLPAEAKRSVIGQFRTDHPQYKKTCDPALCDDGDTVRDHSIYTMGCRGLLLLSTGWYRNNVLPRSATRFKQSSVSRSRGYRRSSALDVTRTSMTGAVA